MLLLSFFLLVSVLLLFFSNVVSYPFDFLTRLASFPRSVMYAAAHAESAPSEQDKLIAENRRLSEKLVQMDALKRDNDALRSQFQDTVLSSQSLLPARVIGSTGALSNPTSLILDQGAKSGIKSGMAVVSGHNLVGEIGRVTTWNSELILPLNKKFSTLAISSEHNSPGIVRGEEDFMLFDHIVITDTVSKNEMVVTKGEDGIPPDLIVGKIITVNKSETQPFQSAVIKSFVNFKKLTTVFVVK